MRHEYRICAQLKTWIVVRGCVPLSAVTVRVRSARHARASDRLAGTFVRSVQRARAGQCADSYRPTRKQATSTTLTI
eukprot:6657160-Prymnesium_polylepis.1